MRLGSLMAFWDQPRFRVDLSYYEDGPCFLLSVCNMEWLHHEKEMEDMENR